MINIAQAQRQRLRMVCEQVLVTPGMDDDILLAVQTVLDMLGQPMEIVTTPQAAPINKAAQPSKPKRSPK